MSSTFKLVLAVNGCVALLTAGATLVVLLIAPLGLAAVLTCTVLVAVLAFTGGVAADLLIWRNLSNGGSPDRAEPRRMEPGGGAALMTRNPGRLPQRHQR